MVHYHSTSTILVQDNCSLDGGCHMSHKSLIGRVEKLTWHGNKLISTSKVPRLIIGTMGIKKANIKSQFLFINPIFMNG